MALFDADSAGRLRLHVRIDERTAGFLALDARFEPFSDRVTRVEYLPWQRLPELLATVDVNLAPLDAKQIFFLTDPQLPQGWHGIIATKDKPGTRVVVHE